MGLKNLYQKRSASTANDAAKATERPGRRRLMFRPLPPGNGYTGEPESTSAPSPEKEPTPASHGRTKVNASGNTEAWSLNGQQALDTNHPFKPSGITNHHATNSEHTDHDTPTTGLTGYKSATVDDSFEMFIMFPPDGQASRYVPTKSVKWLWGGSAKLSDGEWSLTSPEQPAFPETENTNHPTWTENVYNGRY